MGAFSPKEALTSVLHSPVKPLSIYPGETVFTRAKAAHSTARDLPLRKLVNFTLSTDDLYLWSDNTYIGG
jgi:hypothetical protein